MFTSRVLISGSPYMKPFQVIFLFLFVEFYSPLPVKMKGGTPCPARPCQLPHLPPSPFPLLLCRERKFSSIPQKKEKDTQLSQV